MKIIHINTIIFKYFFIFISIFFLAHFAKGQPPPLPAPYLFQAEKGLVYDAAFDYKEHHVSGLLVMKKEGEKYHLVLLSKFGMTLMDFTLDDDGLTWQKTIPQLEKKIVQKMIEKDFRVILQMPLDHPKKVKKLGKNAYKIKKKIKIKAWVSENGKQVEKAETRGFLNLFKGFVQYHCDEETGVPQQITLTHRNVRMKMEMKLLK